MTETENDKIFAGHPKGLSTLFFSEMWERFCYYGMRTLLTLYLVKSLMKGDAEASIIYGAYTGLVYAAPVLGGKMADRYLGYKYAILLGAILMAIGEFMILGGGESWLLLGMGAIIIGNGYFKANISTIVGKLYKDGDAAKRDSGFTIFYIGINLGALGATTIVAYIGETYGFHYGFALAGVGMLLGFLIFATGSKNYKEADGLEITEAGKKKIAGPLTVVHLITIISVALIPLCYVMIANYQVLNYLFLLLFIYVAYSLISAGFKEGKVWGDRMIALVIFILINVVFWACFEQAGTSLTLFADRNVNREILGWTMPASMTQFFNPFFIIVFGSFFSWMWIKLTTIGKNPSIPMKFALGILQLGLGFLVTIIGLNMSVEFQVPLLTLVVLYMLHTTGELFLSPIGLSMVTKLSPKHMAGTAMGAWFLSFAIANLAGGQIAALTGQGHGGGDTDKDAFTVESTVKDAIKKIGDNSVNFEDWKPLKEGDAVNVSLGYYMDVQDWVQYRQMVETASYADWKGTRLTNDTISDPKAWLNAAAWAELGKQQKYYEDFDAARGALSLEDAKERDEALAELEVDAAVLADAKAADENISGLDLKGWKYYRGDFDAVETPNASMKATLTTHQSNVLEKGLNKYVDIFSIIGYVLVGIAILIALLSKPLNKLMHGVQ